MSRSKIEFSDESLDTLFYRWMLKKLSVAEQNHWLHILTYNEEFREAFSDWIKTFRSFPESSINSRKRDRRG